MPTAHAHWPDGWESGLGPRSAIGSAAGGGGERRGVAWRARAREGRALTARIGGACVCARASVKPYLAVGTEGAAARGAWPGKAAEDVEARGRGQRGGVLQTEKVGGQREESVNHVVSL